MSLSFKGHTVVVTGAGGGLGRTYAQLFASRGANVVVNDVSKEAADKVVATITTIGGKAVANNSSVADGAAVIQTAIDAFGGITILVNNAGILRDKSFKNISDQEWDMVQLVHLKGAFSCTKAAWPYFRKQRFGRVVNTASAAGLYGNLGQANYSAAKMGLVGFTKTLAREGAKYGIKATVIAPLAASAMTETIMPPEVLAGFKPEFVAPFVAVLAHPDGPDASGKVFEVGAGYAAEIRWERSQGAVFKPDESFTPSAVQERWNDITNFDNPEYPQHMLSGKEPKDALEAAQSLSYNKQASSAVRFDGKTVIITGSGAGLGRAYAHMYARLGANVVINDVSAKSANAVVDEIKNAGGKAVAAIASAEDGGAIVKTALDVFGSVHVLVANAGILRDKSFAAMSEKEWDDVIAVHLKGTFKCAQAVWPLFQKQKYGRIVTTASSVGIYGNFGQANYSTAKAAIIGLTRSLAIEGRRYNIVANCIAPSAGTAMTQTIWTQEMVDIFKPDYVAPVVGFLTSEGNEDSGKLFEVFAGWAGEVRWQRAGGHGFPVNKPLQPEDVVEKWSIITNFDDGRATNPSSAAEAFQQLIGNFSNKDGEGSDSEGSSPYADPEDSELVAKAKIEARSGPDEFSWDERDIILYHLGIGATEEDLQWTYEGHDDFSVIPTFGVIPQFLTSAGVPADWLPNFNPAKMLHGEQYLAIKAPIPTNGTVITESRIMEVLDKGKASSVTLMVETKDKKSGKVIFENQQTLFFRGSGGFGGKRNGNDRGAASATNTIPNRKPDAVVEEQTHSHQGALYRLNGDRNPLHILPEFAAVAGFDKPILHGLCFFGYAGRHVLKTFGPFKDIKTRFAGVVYPGETLVTEMWKQGNKIIFTTKVKERNSIVLTAAAATLVDGAEAPKAKL
ncbi:multifunctional beta-oxidation protein [Ramaria rubella]|nr:multifunctional beta-oxidation protein [Ramaria rubella]